LDRQKLSIMFIWAHLGDFATEGSGTAAIHADLGDTITTVLCTYGERHHNDLFMEEDETPGRGRNTKFVRATLDQIRAMKEREARRIGKILGTTELIFLGWEDTYKPDLVSGSRVKELADILLRVRPDVVVTHIPVDKGRRGDAHARIGQMVLSATREAANQVRQVDGIVAHLVKEIFYAPMGGEIPDTQRDMLYDDIVPDVWIDITPVLARKVQAFDQIATQSYHGQRARKSVESRDGWRGTVAGVSYAECFVRSSGVVYSSLPMPPSVLNKKLTASGLAADLTIAHKIPLATPDDAFELPPGI